MAYYAVKISDVPTPPKYSHKMPSKTGQSEYYLKYGSSRGKSVPEKKFIMEHGGSNVKMPHSTITGYQSVYNVSDMISSDWFCQKSFRFFCEVRQKEIPEIWCSYI